MAEIVLDSRAQHRRGIPAVVAVLAAATVFAASGCASERDAQTASARAPAPVSPAPVSPAPVSPAPVAAAPVTSAPTAPGSFRVLPSTSRQVIRVTRSNAFCSQVYCAVIEAWEKGADGDWRKAKAAGTTYSVRTQIGRKGFAPSGQKREGDARTPTGVYGIVTTFSTDERNPGTRMPWRQRKASSNVGSRPGPQYNAWYEVPGGGGGNRPAMRYGIWVDYNHGRLAPGQGRAPVPGAGSGIFIHVRGSDAPYAPSFGCPMAAPEYLRWMLAWLDPAANPRVMLNV